MSIARRTSYLVALLFAALLTASLIDAHNQVTLAQMFTDLPGQLKIVTSSSSHVLTVAWQKTSIAGVFGLITGVLAFYVVFAERELRADQAKPHFDIN